MNIALNWVLDLFINKTNTLKNEQLYYLFF